MDEIAWEVLYRTQGRAIPVPKDGNKVAEKVIDHYGVEVLKVFEI